jgi:hypothetical protein
MNRVLIQSLDDEVLTESAHEQLKRVAGARNDVVERVEHPGPSRYIFLPFSVARRGQIEFVNPCSNLVHQR